jgi:hypothetical protein
MKKLQENGLLKRVGADKNGHWEYHQQALEIAFSDIDSLATTHKHALLKQ